MKIMVKRTGALGDVLDTTPIVARLRREYPDAEIDVVTAHPAAYYGNTDISYVWTNSMGSRGYNLTYDLDNVHENSLRKVHSIDCYSKFVFNDTSTSKQVKLAYSEPPGWIKTDWSKTVVLHPAKSWPQRTLPVELWQAIATRLQQSDLTLVTIGTTYDWALSDDRIINTRGKCTLAEQAAIIAASRCYVGSDTGMVFVAYATPTPIICLGTMTLPWMNMRERDGQLGKDFYPIMANVPCVGCLHEIATPVTFSKCRWFGTRDENKCTTAFNPEQVFTKVEEIVK